MTSPSSTLEANLRASAQAKLDFLADTAQLAIFESAVNEVINRYKNGGRLYIGGNGGSAADAQHLAAEFVSKLAKDRDPLPAEALTVDSSIITAIGNDYGYEKVLSRQLKGKATDKDIFLGITTSGNSPNIINALDECKERGIPSIVFTGRGGGNTRKKADYCVCAAGDMTGTIQDIHIVLAHTLCECVESAISFGD